MIGHAEGKLDPEKMIRWRVVVLEGQLEDRVARLEATCMLDSATDVRCFLQFAEPCSLGCPAVYPTKWASSEYMSDVASDYGGCKPCYPARCL